MLKVTVSLSSPQKTIVTPLVLLLENLRIYCRFHEFNVHFNNLMTQLLCGTWKRRREFSEPKFFDNGGFYLDTPYILFHLLELFACLRRN